MSTRRMTFSIVSAIFGTININGGFAHESALPACGDGQGSVRDGENCFRFDIMRNRDNPNQFYLHEMYANRGAHATHREQSYYVAWRSAVERMFEGDLGRVEMETVFPSDDGWRAQKPGLVNC